MRLLRAYCAASIILASASCASVTYAITSERLYAKADSLFRSDDVFGVEELCRNNRLLMNSMVDIALDRFARLPRMNDSELREQTGRLARLLLSNREISPFLKTFGNRIIDSWQQKDFDQYLRGLSLRVVGARPGIVGWQDSLRLAIEIFESLGSTNAVARTEYAFGNRYYDLEKKYDSAQIHFQQAEALTRIVANNDQLCKILIASSNSVYKLNNGATEAIVKMEEALKIACDAGLHEQIIDCNNGLGAIYFYLNYYREASNRFRVADSICLAHTLGGRRYYPMVHLGLSLDKLGDFDAADSVFTDAAKLVSADENGEGTLAWIYVYQSAIRLDLSDTVGIREKLESARQIAEKTQDPKCRTQVMYLLGRLDRVARNYTKSEQELSQALNEFRDIKDMFYPTKELGLAHFDNHQYDSAHLFLDSAKSLLLLARKDMPRSVLRHRYLIDKYDLVAALIDLSLRTNNLLEALDLAEDFRAQSLTESINEATIAGHESEKYAAEKAAVEKEIARLIRSVRLCGTSAREIPTVAEHLERLQDSLMNIGLIEAGLSPSHSTVKTANHRDFMTYSSRNNIGLYYFVHNDNVLVWYCRSGLMYFENISESHPETLKDVHLALDRLKDRPVSAKEKRSLDSILIRLQSLLPESLHSSIDSTDILQIYPSGILSYFPFETIRLGDLYLGQVAPIEYYPCLTIRNLIPNAQTARERLQRIFLFGGSFEQKDHPGCEYPTTDFVSRYTDPGYLPGVEDETAAIQQASDRYTTDLVHRYNQEEIISATDFESVDIVHFATHGLIMDDYPEFSGLLLPIDGSSGTDEVLRVSEITSYSINAPLIVLSACRSGLGEYVTGEGIMGLSRSFIVAGARSVVVTLWPIDDQVSAHYFAKSFYDSILGGKSTGESLFEMRKLLINQGVFSSPYYWAPFAAYGNWR